MSDLLLSLFDQIEAQQATLEKYASLEERLSDERNHKEKLEKKFQDLYASAALHVTFVQEMHSNLRREHGDTLKRCTKVHWELSKRLDQLREINSLESEFHEVKVKH